METAEEQDSEQTVFLCTEYTKVQAGLLHFAPHAGGRVLTHLALLSSPDSELFQGRDHNLQTLRNQCLHGCWVAASAHAFLLSK